MKKRVESHCVAESRAKQRENKGAGRRLYAPKIHKTIVCTWVHYKSIT